MRDGSVPVIVTLDVGTAAPGTAQRRAAAQAMQSAVVSRLASPVEVVPFRFIPALALRVGAADLERLRGDRRVVSVEEDLAVPPAAIPARERLDDTTALVGATAAWAAGFDGQGTEIAILDTGVDTGHPFLAGRIVGEACFSTQGDGYTSLCPNGEAAQVGPGAGFLCDESALGGCRHGTAVAGVAGGRNPGGPVPAAGVAPGAGLISIQVYSVTDCGGRPCITSRASDQLRALDYVYGLAAGGRPIAAANLSLGGGRYTATCDASAFQAAAEALREVGVATVVASGNGGDPAATTYPGCASAAVTVGATTKSDAVWAGSNTAPWLDLVAPGVGIVSSVSGGGFGEHNGTSVAAPHVAGAFAILRERFPDAPVSDLLARLQTSGVEVAAPIGTVSRIQIDAALTDPPVLTAVIEGGPGWRMLSVPAAGVTVADLAAINLVQGVPGYYPAAGSNLYTGYDGAAYTRPGSDSTVIAPGRGFWWRFYDIEGPPGGPSTSHALPTTLTTSRPAVTTDTPVTLIGTAFNLLGNPFGTSLDVSDIASWPGAMHLASTVVQMWKAAGSTYEPSVLQPVVASWQGFWAEGATAGTLTIPERARVDTGARGRVTDLPLIALELASADGAHVDRAAVLTFGEGARADQDAGDAAKIEPISAVHVMLAFMGDGGLHAVENRPLAAATLPVAVVSVGAGEDLVLTWPRLASLPDGWVAVLRDLETGATANLLEARAYAFSVTPRAERSGDAVPAAARASGLTARFELVVGPRGATAGEGGAGSVFTLDAPAPNPARGRTTLAFSLATPGAARLTLVDLLGREVAVVAEGDQAAGRHVATLDTGALAPGVYVVRLASGAQQATQRLVVVR